MRLRLAVVALLVGMTGCGQPPLTELVVVVRTEVPMNRVTIQISNPEHVVIVDRSIDAPPFPLTAVLLRDHPPYDPVHVEVVGYGVGTISRSATTAFVEGKRVELDLLLESACRCAISCGPGVTCHAGACQNDAVDATMLPVYVAPDAAVTVIDSGAPRDFGVPHDLGSPMTDAGTLDAGPRDLGAGVTDAGPIDAGHDAGPHDAGTVIPTGPSCGCMSEACCSAADCMPGLSCRAGICQSCTPTAPMLNGAYGGATVTIVSGTASTIDIRGMTAAGPIMGNIALSPGISASGHAATMTRFTSVSATGNTITFTDMGGTTGTIQITGATVSGSATFTGTSGLSFLQAMMSPRLTLGDGSSMHSDITFTAGETCH